MASRQSAQPSMCDSTWSTVSALSRPWTYSAIVCSVRQPMPGWALSDEPVGGGRASDPSSDRADCVPACSPELASRCGPGFMRCGLSPARSCEVAHRAFSASWGWAATRQPGRGYISSGARWSAPDGSDSVAWSRSMRSTSEDRSPVQRAGMSRQSRRVPGSSVPRTSTARLSQLPCAPGSDILTGCPARSLSPPRF